MIAEYKPRPYQPLITDHILDLPRCMVFAGMGTGKTSATLTALDVLMLSEGGKVLVVAPLRVARTTWPDEVKKWGHTAHMRVSMVLGSKSERERALDADADIYTINYEQLPWLIANFGEKWPFTIVVCDEATKLKGYRFRQGGKRAQAFAQVAHTSKVKRMILLTGTPCPNGLKDLWGQVWFADKGHRLGRTFTAFKDRWFKTAPNGFGIEPMAHSQGQIQKALEDLCITIDAKDWFDLKEPITTNIFIELPPAAQKLYSRMEKEMYMELSGKATDAVNAAAKTQKCLQIAAGACYVGEEKGDWEHIHDEKLDALEEIIEESGGMPVLVAYSFKHDLVRLQKRFTQGRMLDANPQTIADWNAGKIPVLFAHPASAGHGLNLQDGGNILVFFSPDWNLENRLQIIERIGPTRQAQAGHDRPVFIYNILCKSSVDELVLERVETKREVQDILLDAMKRKGIV